VWPLLTGEPRPVRYRAATAAERPRLWAAVVRTTNLRHCAFVFRIRVADRAGNSAVYTRKVTLRRNQATP
jgi:hypothetical protein